MTRALLNSKAVSKHHTRSQMYANHSDTSDMCNTRQKVDPVVPSLPKDPTPEKRYLVHQIIQGHIALWYAVGRGQFRFSFF